MKIPLLIVLTTLFSSLIFAQSEGNRYWQLPCKYNSFINLPDIDWACEIFSDHEFDIIQKERFDIHSYLIKAQLEGRIKSYQRIDYLDSLAKTKGKAVDDLFFEMPKEYNDAHADIVDRTVEFQEIFYYKSHRLYSHIISAAPAFKVFTAETHQYIGNSITSYSSLNYYPGSNAEKKDEIIYLGDTHRILNFDSIEQRSSLKKNYGMTLTLLLWHDLSLGFNQAIALKDGKIIPANEIMTTSPFDSIVYFLGDTIPAIMQKVPPPPIFQYFSDVELQQSWYYNKTKDVFFNKINKLYIYSRSCDPKTFLWNNQRRYEVVFK